MSKVTQKQIVKGRTMSLILATSTVLRNRDKIDLIIGNGTFHAIGEVAYIEVHYGEYNEGDYAEPGYMVTMGAYFPLNKMDEALAYYGLLTHYYERCDNDPEWGITSGGKKAAFYEMKEKAKRAGYSMEEIKKMHNEYFGIKQ